MIKKIAYLIVLLLFVVIAFMALSINKNSQQKNIPLDQFDVNRPDYDTATPNEIFKTELGI